MKRKTVSKRLTTKLKAYKDWIKANRVMPTAWLMQRTAAKLEGHYAYYGVTDNSRSIGNFAHLVKQILFKWLNRRGKRGCYTWEKFQKLLERHPLPAPRIKVNLLSAKASATVHSLIGDGQGPTGWNLVLHHHVLQHIGGASTVEEIEALLPWNVTLSKLQEG